MGLNIGSIIGKVFKEGNDTTIYILPQFVNKRMTFPETVSMCKSLHNTFKDGHYAKFVIEDVAYQRCGLFAENPAPWSPRRKVGQHR